MHRDVTPALHGNDAEDTVVMEDVLGALRGLPASNHDAARRCVREGRWRSARGAHPLPTKSRTNPQCEIAWLVAWATRAMAVAIAAREFHRRCSLSVD